MSLPEESLLIPFFQEAASRLEKCKINIPCSLDEIRRQLLLIQTECLESMVSSYNNSHAAPTSTPLSLADVQNQLRTLINVSSQVRAEMVRMNDAARLAFCRLVLYSECLLEVRACGHCQQHPSHENNNGRPFPLKTSGRMERDDVLEFIGLCEVAVRLPNVQKYLSAGNMTASDPKAGLLFLDIPLPTSSIFPQKRLEFIQRLLLRAVGYDSSHGYNEIKRIFFLSTEPNEFSNDVELVELFAKMSSHMDAAITNATLQATSDVFLSDHNQGGCTRIVAVSYSEKLLDPKSGEEITMDDDVTASTTSSLPPSSQTMEQQSESQQLQKLYLAKETAKLHQEILGELLSMRDEEREARLAQAKDAVHEFLQQMSQLDDPQERVSLLQKLDDKTQRLLLMDKLWSAMLYEHGGKVPIMN